ncbi:hypothetical protein NE237_018912 [Protea cynaroides]|uniref:SRR1-like domain-containing protein n=1 Tax=Protea cynaroides TaxID=273540 RepID=A0A9Q0QPG9_9MAGN|nr:hypothetical protein NE237_018912 [Protea cynaroides]
MESNDLENTDNIKDSDIVGARNCSNTVIKVEDKVGRLLDQMDIIINEFRSSEVYQEIHDQWQNNPSFRSNIDRVLGCNSKILMVIYALGSIESSYRSQVQLALAILLKLDFSHWLSGIEAYDPVISVTDAKVMEALGCSVLSVNEECRRLVDKPTLFYMPFANTEHMANLLEANWCPSRLNQMILLATSFEGKIKSWRKVDEKPWEPPFFHHGLPTRDYLVVRERIDYIEALQKHTVEFAMTGEKKAYRNSLYNFSCHFLDLDQQLDMASLLPAGGGSGFLKIGTDGSSDFLKTGNGGGSGFLKIGTGGGKGFLKISTGGGRGFL